MKSLQESLFDKDLVTRGVKIDFEALRDMLFNFGRKRAKLFDKTGVVYHEGRQSIFLKKFLDNSNRDGSVCFELEFGVTNTYKEVFTERNGVRYGGMHNCSAFNVPSLWIHDRWGSSLGSNAWKGSRADINATRRAIDKKVELENDDRSIATIEATDENVGKVFDLYDEMIKEFCSTEFEKKLKEYISRYEGKKEIPGLIIDILMKQLIKKA